MSGPVYRYEPDHLPIIRVYATTEILAARFRRVLAAHGRVPLDQLDQTVTELLEEVTR